MILETQYAYVVEARLRGRKDAKQFVLVESAPVMIAEVSLEDAPVAYWWHPTALKTTRPGQNKDCPAQVAVRLVGGELFQPITAWETEEAGVKPRPDFVRGAKQSMPGLGLMTPEVLKTYLSTNSLNAAGGKLSEAKHQKSEVEQNLIKEVRSSNRDSRLAMLAEHYERFRLIDGVAHVRVKAPVIDLTLVDHYGSRIRLVEQDSHFEQPHNIMSLADFAAARKIFAKNRNGTSEPTWKLIAPEIMIPDAVAVDVHALMIRKTASRALQSLSSNNYRNQPSLASEPLEAVIAYGELRDAMDDGSAPATVFQMLEALAEHAARSMQGVDVVALRKRLDQDGFEFATAMEGPRP